MSRFWVLFKYLAMGIYVLVRWEREWGYIEKILNEAEPLQSREWHITTLASWLKYYDLWIWNASSRRSKTNFLLEGDFLYFTSHMTTTIKSINVDIFNMRAMLISYYIYHTSIWFKINVDVFHIVLNFTDYKIIYWSIVVKHFYSP